MGRLRHYLEMPRQIISCFGEMCHDFYDATMGGDFEKYKKAFVLGTSAAGGMLGASIGSEYGHPAYGALIGNIAGLVGPPLIFLFSMGLADEDIDDDYGPFF